MKLVLLRCAPLILQGGSIYTTSKWPS